MICSWRLDRRWSSILRLALPFLAKRWGARLVIINREPTDVDDDADLVIHDDIGNTLEPFIAGG